MRLVDPRLVLAALVLLLSPLRLDAIVSFSTTEQAEDVGVSNPQAITLADLNGDNIDDLITVTDIDTVAVYLNDGEGMLAFDADYDILAEGPVAVATGLFNDDNFLDIAAANNGSGTVTVLLGRGDGTFDDEEDPFRVLVGAGPIGIGVGDINNDREDDLLVLSGNLVYVLQGNGDGSFSAGNPPTINTRSTGSFAIAVGLLDADTNLDFAVANRDNAQVVTFFGNGNGTFTFGQFIAAGDSPTGIIIADADGDRDNDLLAVDSAAVPFDEVRLMRNNGDPDDAFLFDTAESIVSTEGPLAITALDVEPDNKVDIAVTTVNPDQMSLLCQPSDKCETQPGEPLEPSSGQGGIFRQPRAGTVPGCTEEGQVAVVSGKLNGDDMDDLVSLGGDLATLCISLNTSRVGGVGTPSTATSTPTGPTATPTETRTLAPTPTATEVPVIGLGVCNTATGFPSLSLGRPVAVASEDFDRDGDRDVAVADASGNRIVILRTTLIPAAVPDMKCNTLNLQQGAAIPVMGPRKLATADLDRDGSADLAVIGEQGLSVFYGDGTGGFRASGANPMPAGVDPSDLAVTDFNRDFTPDIIVSDMGSQNVSIFLGTRQQGEPFPGRCAMSVGRTTNLVVAADLNADARADFAVAGPVARDIGVFLQRVDAPLACDNMAASFQGQSALSLPNEPVGMVVGLFTFTDSVPDLAIAMRAAGRTGTVMLFEGRPAGATGVTYVPGTPVPVPTPKGETVTTMPTDISSGDIERDGRIDLLVTDSRNNDLAEFRGQSSGGIGIALEPLDVEGVGPVDLEAVDIDRDGRDDVITANAGDGSVTYMLSNQRQNTPTPVPTNSPTITPTPVATQAFSPTITLSPTRTRRPSPSQTPEPTHTQRGVVSLSSGGCAIDDGSNDSGTWLLTGLGFLAVIMRRRVQALLGG